MSYKSTSITSSQNQKLFVHQWPTTIAKAKLIIVHGYAEHSYRYDEFARYLNEHSIEVLSYDQVGYGRSEGVRGYVDRFSTYINDLDKFMDHIDLDNSSAPVFLLGHSMGGLVATQYCLTNSRASSLAGLITSAALLKLDEDLSPILQMIAPLLGMLFPKLKTEKLDQTYLTRSEENLKAYNADPLNYLEGTRARTGAEMIKTTKAIPKAFHSLSIPLLAMHGTGDKITDRRGTEQLYNDANSIDKELKMYDGLYHELLHEPEKVGVMNDIIEWINNRI